jgi:hypothetical protein
MQRQRRHEHSITIKTEPAVTVELTLAPPRGRRSKVVEPPPKRAPATSQGRVPRIARLMALAIHFQDLIDRGVIRDYAELARLGYVSRARITQIMNLLNLAPDIQQGILGWNSDEGGTPTSEHAARRVAAHIFWVDQRLAFSVLETQRGAKPHPPEGRWPNLSDGG